MKVIEPSYEIIKMGLALMYHTLKERLDLEKLELMERS
jgi:hypothetical protein